MRPVRMMAALILLVTCITAGLVVPVQAAAPYYVYDDKNRLIEVHFDDSTWIGYTYDDNGNRIGKQHTIGADHFTVTAGCGAGGGVSPASASVLYGENQTFTITSDIHYHIAALLVDGGSAGTSGSYTFHNVTAPHSLQASFTIDTNNITASAGSNGSITPSGIVPVNYGSDQSFTFTPASHYHVDTFVVNGTPVAPATSYTFTNVTAAQTIAVAFAIDTNNITASAGANGSITPSGSVPVNYGSDQPFTISPAIGYHVDTLSVNGTPVIPPTTSYTFTNVTVPQTIAATFAINTYTITTSISGGSGTISPPSATVNYGGSKAFAITPSAGYYISGVIVDGVLQQWPMDSYTFSNVSANHTLSASFISSSGTVKNARTNALYATLQAAYGDSTTLDGDTIQCQAVLLNENFTANRSISVSILGGYVSDFSSNPYMTGINGAPFIQSGAVTMWNFVITN